MIRSLRGLACGGGVLISALSARGGDLTPPPGPAVPTMLTLQQIEPRTPIQSLPGDATAVHIISEPGSYYLTGNILGDGAKDGISVRAHNVSIDMMGFSLDGNDPFASGTGIKAEPPQAGTPGPVRVKNGTVIRWGGAGIDLTAAGLSMVSDVFAFDCGGRGIDSGVGIVQDCRVRRSVDDGIVATGIVTRCISTFNERRGIDVTEGVVVDCVAASNERDGFKLSDSVATRCMSEINGGTIDTTPIGGGFLIDGSVLTSSLARFNTVDGVRALADLAPSFDAVLVRDCLAIQNANTGFDFHGPALISNCDARANFVDGISTSQFGTIVAHCSLHANQASGILASTDSYVFNNFSAAGFRGVSASGAFMRIDSNTSLGNAIGMQTDLSTESLIISNVAAGVGSFLVDTDSASGIVINAALGVQITTTSSSANISY